MSIYDTTLLLIGHPIPPASSWWVRLSDEQFTVAARREFHLRMMHQRLPKGVERALAQAEASWRYPDKRLDS